MARVAKPLSDTKIRALKPKDKLYELSDGNGLQIRITPVGTKKWLFKYHKPGTKKRTNLYLGEYPILSLAEARVLRTDYKKLLANGIDPSAHKIKSANDTFKAVTIDWLEIKKQKVSADHATDILHSFDNHVFPTIGDTPISTITAPDAIDALKPLSAKGNHEQVRRVCTRINEVMTFAVNTGLIEQNNCAGIRDAFIAPTKTNLPTLKPEELPELLEAVFNASIRKTTRNLLLFQLHTMVRPSEASATVWDEIDIDKGLWTIPPERMKKNREHIVPLTSSTIKLLNDMKKICKHSDYVFPGDRNIKSPVNPQSANMAIKRMGFKGRLVAHGMRSMASTTLNEQGFEAELIEVSLAHIDKNTVRSAYNRAGYVERRREMYNWWSDHINQSLATALGGDND